MSVADVLTALEAFAPLAETLIAVAVVLAILDFFIGSLTRAGR